MRIASRLVLTLGLTTTAVMAVYGLVALQQRESLLRDALSRETDTLARSAQIVVNNALRDGRFADLDRVLGRIAEDPQTLVAAVIGEDGRVLAGERSSALDCLRSADGVAAAIRAAPTAEAGGWVECNGGARWVALPVGPPEGRVVIGRRATVLERDLATSGWRILLTTVALAGAAALVILLVLDRVLSAPLAKIMTGVRSLGGPDPPRSITVPRSAGELRDLALAFNEMAERLEAKRAALLAEVDERIALEGRLRSAEKFAALGRLSGGLAHELGSPLNAIEVRAERIEALAEAPAEARRHAREIVAEVERIAELVHGLRHVSRHHPLEPGPVDLVEAAESAARDARELANAAAVALEVEAPADVTVRGDIILLRHAIANLVVNAIQALRDRTDGRRVGVRVDRHGDRARVVVEDNGPGIPPEARSRLFEPFFTTRDVGEGMGLGLAISRGIVEEHGGELRIEDRPGGGTRACLMLPLDPTRG